MFGKFSFRSKESNNKLPDISVENENNLEGDEIASKKSSAEIIEQSSKSNHIDDLGQGHAQVSNNQMNNIKHIGMQGWLYREMETKESFSLVWVAVAEKKLLYSDTFTSKDNPLTHPVRICTGYIDLQPGHCEVKRKYTESSSKLLHNNGTSIFQSHHNNKSNQLKSSSSSLPTATTTTLSTETYYYFQIRYKDMHLIFRCNKETECNEWIRVIKDAIQHQIYHIIDNPVLTTHFPSFPTPTPPLPFYWIDYPIKKSYLKKISSDGKFGRKVVNKRFFVLDGGEFSYFDTDNSHPNECKGWFDLRDAEIIDGVVDGSSQEMNSTPQFLSRKGGNTSGPTTPVPPPPPTTPSSHPSNEFFLKLPHCPHHKVLRLKATTHSQALEWIAVLLETIVLVNSPHLAMGYSSSSHDSLTASGPGLGLGVPYSSRKSFRSEDIVTGPSSHRKHSIGSVFEHSGPHQYATQRRKNLIDSSSHYTHVRTITTDSTPSLTTTSSSITAETPTVHSADTVKRTSFLKTYQLGSDQGQQSQKGILNGGISEQSLDRLTATLHQHYLLQHLSNTDLLSIIGVCEERNYVGGEIVLWQGTTYDGLYLLDSGHCDLIHDGTCIGEMYPGQSFGMHSLLHDVLRGTTVRCLHSSRFYTLPRSKFRAAMYEIEENNMDRKMKFLKQVSLFENWVETSLLKIAEVMRLEEFVQGDKIVKQGDVGDRLFMILVGRVNFVQTKLTGGTTELTKLGPYQYFGELALMEHSTRKATVSAIDKRVQCYTVDGVTFLNLFGSLQSPVNESMGIKVLRKVPLLEPLSDRQLITISKNLQLKTFSINEVIIQQGDVGESFYMLSAGEVSVVVNHIQVAVLKAGSYFGERSLLTNERRNASVVALTNETTCLILSRSSFDQLLGPLETILQMESKKRTEAIQNTKSENLLINKFKRLSNGLFIGSNTSSSSSSPKTSPHGNP